nr:retrovirus-related Pol polyprotein from transposon TNT 1-94 [Tanacetum cinerariifolium]
MFFGNHLFLPLYNNQNAFYQSLIGLYRPTMDSSTSSQANHPYYPLNRVNLDMDFDQLLNTQEYYQSQDYSMGQGSAHGSAYGSAPVDNDDNDWSKRCHPTRSPRNVLQGPRIMMPRTRSQKTTGQRRKRSHCVRLEYLQDMRAITDDLSLANNPVDEEDLAIQDLMETYITSPIEGREGPTEAEKKAINAEKLKDLKCKNYWFQVIDCSILETILKKDTSKEIWDSLKQMYQGTAQSSILIHEHRMGRQVKDKQALQVTHQEGSGRGRGFYQGRGRGRGQGCGGRFGYNKSTMEYFNCHELGHFQWECPKEVSITYYTEAKEEMLLMPLVECKQTPYEHLWFLDSGCSNYMCGNKDMFFNLDSMFKESVKLGNNSTLTVHGKGTVRLEINGVVLSFCNENGIQRQLTAAYTPQQNGIAGRKYRTIMNMVRSVLSAKKVPKTFWPKAVNWVVHVLNQSPTLTVKDTTPEEAWSGIKPSVHYFLVFGCIGHVHVPDAKRIKNDAKSLKCILFGVSDESKAYRLFDLTSNKILVSRDVVFEEDEQWSWDDSHKQAIQVDLEWEHDEEQAEAESFSTQDEASTHTEMSPIRSEGGISSITNAPVQHRVDTQITEIREGERRRRTPSVWLKDYETGEGLFDKETAEMTHLAMFADQDPTTLQEAVI